jgi:hypothetical protein
MRRIRQYTTQIQVEERDICNREALETGLGEKHGI